MTVAWVRFPTFPLWVGRSGPRFLALSAVGGVILWLAACEPYEPELGMGGFVLPGQHAEATCEECHGPPPFTTMVWDTTCISCHDEDRKPNDPLHATYDTCSGSGCHTDLDVDWKQAIGNLPEDHMVLEGPHAAGGCAPCHSAAVPSLEDVIPPGGNSTYCWSCHEEDRLLHPAGEDHFTDDPLEDPTILPDAELRWDCKACHDQRARGAPPLSSQWGLFRINHGVAGREVKVPHGTQGADRISLTERVPFAITDPTLWVVACEDCHPNPADFKAYTCTTECHAEIFEVVPGVSPLAVHATWAPGANDNTCTLVNCHPTADMRLTQ